MKAEKARTNVVERLEALPSEPDVEEKVRWQQEPDPYSVFFFTFAFLSRSRKLFRPD